MTYHTTVLLHEGVEALNLKPGGVYVDATFGGGGHSRLILEKLEGGRLIAFDQDPDAARNAPSDERFELCRTNFRYTANFLAASSIRKVDGILADLGVSGHQFDEGPRGFSFRFDAPLDMRMNPEQPRSAQTVLNEYEEAELRRMFREYGETMFAYAIAARVATARIERPLTNISDLVAAIEKAIPAHKLKDELAKVFQAVRIEVNDEIGALKMFLQTATAMLKPGARLVVISYHSLEDRPVKHFMRSGNFRDEQVKDLYGNLKRPLMPVGKVITPTAAEIARNPRARSAKMRIAERTTDV